MDLLKKTFLCFALLISGVAFAQNKQPIDAGIGVVAASDAYQYEVIERPPHLFEDEDLTRTWEGALVSPFFNKPDYGLYHFICLEKTSQFYKILVNDNETVYLPVDSSFKFMNWRDLVIGAQVERKSNENLLRISPDKKAKAITRDCDRESLLVLDMIEKEGLYWMQVVYHNECGEIPRIAEEGKKAWLQWRNKNELLVLISLLC